MGKQSGIHPTRGKCRRERKYVYQELEDNSTTSQKLGTRWRQTYRGTIPRKARVIVSDCWVEDVKKTVTLHEGPPNIIHESEVKGDVGVSGMFQPSVEMGLQG